MGPKLKKSINFIDAFAILIASLGGNSIFVAVGTVVHFTGSVGMALVAIFIVGLLNLSLTRCVLEVSLLLPEAGGPYFYLWTVFGPILAFLFLWMYILCTMGPVMAISSYTSALSLLQLGYPDCAPPVYAVVLVALCILLSVILVNCLYLKYVTRVQMFLSFSKLLGMIMIIACGVITVTRGDIGELGRLFEGSKTEIGDLAMGCLSVQSFWGGWLQVTFLVGIAKEPAKTLPKALASTLASMFFLTELTFVSYYTVLNKTEAGRSDAIATIFMEKFFNPLSAVATAFALLTSVGMLNSCMLGPSRLLLAAAKKGQLHEIFTLTSEKYQMPWICVLSLTLMPILLLVFTSVRGFIVMLSVSVLMSIISVLVCLVVLKWTQPDRHRPVRVWTSTAVTQLFIHCAILVLSIYQKPTEVSKAFIIVLAGIPVYYITNKWTHRPKNISKMLGRLTVLCQKVFVLEI